MTITMSFPLLSGQLPIEKEGDKACRHPRQMTHERLLDFVHVLFEQT